MSNCNPITKLEQRGRKVRMTDMGVETIQEYYLEPYGAYREVAEWLLGRPDVLIDEQGDGITHLTPRYPPRTDPYHKNIRCFQVEVDHLPREMSTGRGVGSGPRQAPATPLIVSTNFNIGAVGDTDPPYLEAIVNGFESDTVNPNMPKYKGAFIRAYYHQRQEWLVETEITTRNFSLPNQLLQWKNIVDANNDPLPLGYNAPLGETGAVKTQQFTQITIYPYRYPVGALKWPNWITWSRLAGRVNEDDTTLNLAGLLDGRAIGSLGPFAAETLMFEGMVNKSELTTLGKSNGVSRVDSCPYRPIAYDYWNMGYRFLFNGTWESDAAKFVEPPTPITVGDGFDPAGGLYFPGWNRFWFPGDPETSNESGVWDVAEYPDGSGRRVYQYDTEVTNGTVTGFNILFNSGTANGII